MSSVVVYIINILANIPLWLILCLGGKFVNLIVPAFGPFAITHEFTYSILLRFYCYIQVNILTKEYGSHDKIEIENLALTEGSSILCDASP